MPPSLRARFQRFTEDAEAFTISIPSPILLPSSRSRPASRRRVSNSAALPCFLMNYCTHGHTTRFIYRAKVNKADPDDPEPYCARALAFHLRHDLDAAISDYTKAISLDPCYAHAWKERAHIESARREFQRAIDDATIALVVE